MNASSASITWQSWSRKWGEWSNWLRKATEEREPLITSPHQPSRNTGGSSSLAKTFYH